jgi:S-(hydroxymethyl)glutathione dehydrogenase/alcohol dehydrogenase
VAIFGCGGVGLAAVLGAVVVGASPIIAVDIREGRRDAAVALGATATVDAAGDGVAESLRAIAPGGVDHAIVAVGDARAIEHAVQSLAVGGTCVVLGIPPTGAGEVRISSHHLLSGERRVIGSVYGTSNPPLAFPQLLSLHRAGRLPLERLVTRRYTLDETNEAFADLAAGELSRGLIVFSEADWETI